MLAIVFQLLMFLMIAINFESMKADERIKLPKDALARPPAVKSEHEFVLNVGYERDSSGNRTKRLPVVFHQDRSVEIAHVDERLAQERRVMETVYGRDVMKDVTVVILADADVPAGQVQELVQKCQANGFSKFSLRATTKGR